MGARCQGGGRAPRQLLLPELHPAPSPTSQQPPRGLWVLLLPVLRSNTSFFPWACPGPALHRQPGASPPPAQPSPTDPRCSQGRGNVMLVGLWGLHPGVLAPCWVTAFLHVPRDAVLG